MFGRLSHGSTVTDVELEGRRRRRVRRRIESTSLRGGDVSQSASYIRALTAHTYSYYECNTEVQYMYCSPRAVQMPTIPPLRLDGCHNAFQPRGPVFFASPPMRHKVAGSTSVLQLQCTYTYVHVYVPPLQFLCRSTAACDLGCGRSCLRSRRKGPRGPLHFALPAARHA